MTTGDVIDDVATAPPIKLRSSDCTRKLYSVEETISYVYNLYMRVWCQLKTEQFSE